MRCLVDKCQTVKLQSARSIRAVRGMWLKGMSVGVCGELGRDCVTALGKLSTPYANRKHLSGSQTRWSASEVAKTGGGISFRRHRLISKTETVLCGPTAVCLRQQRFLSVSALAKK